MISSISGKGLFRVLTGKFKGMRKEQEFSIYEMSDKTNIVIQSGTRIGRLNLVTKVLELSKAFSSGAYFHHLTMSPLTKITLDDESISKVIEFRSKLYND